MADKFVRLVGRVEDMDGLPLDVGVNYDTVTIGRYVFTQEMAEEFAQLFIKAVWQAGVQAAEMAESDLDGPT